MSSLERDNSRAPGFRSNFISGIHPARLIILREGKAGACARGRVETKEAEGRRERDRKRRPRTFVKNRTQGWARRLAPWRLGRIEDKERKTAREGDDEREKTQVPAEKPGYNAGSASRCLATKKKDSRAIYWPESREFMRRFALAGGSTHDEKPKFLSNPLYSSRCSFPASISLCFYTRLGWFARNWRNKRDVLLSAINIKCATFDFSRLLSNKFVSSSGYRMLKNV